MKIEVGFFKNGEPRYEVRHLNDIKVAHDKSLVAPVQRSALGRKPASVPAEVSRHTDKQNKTNNVVPENPPNSTGSAKTNKLVDAAKIQTELNTGSSSNADPTTSRYPARATRNARPQHIDSFGFNVTPWSALLAEVNALNKLIGVKKQANSYFRAPSP